MHHCESDLIIPQICWPKFWTKFYLLLKFVLLTAVPYIRNDFSVIEISDILLFIFIPSTSSPFPCWSQCSLDFLAPCLPHSLLLLLPNPLDLHRSSPSSVAFPGSVLLLHIPCELESYRQVTGSIDVEGTWSLSGAAPLSTMSPERWYVQGIRNLKFVWGPPKFWREAPNFKKFKTPWGQKNACRLDLASDFQPVIYVHNLSLINWYLCPHLPLSNSTLLVITSGRFHLTVRLTPQTQNWTPEDHSPSDFFMLIKLLLFLLFRLKFRALI